MSTEDTTAAGAVNSVAVEEEPTSSPAVAVSAAAAIELRVPTQEVIRPLDAGQVVDAMRGHQDLLRQILDESDWQGKPDADGSFVKKSGWRKIALAYNLTVVRIHEEVERGAEGKPLRAGYTARAIAPTGRAMEATGYCAFAESRFSGPRGNQSKLENDMRATAATRATNRAISDLIGMGRVSAEEVGAPPAGDPALPWGPKLDMGEESRVAVSQALVGLVGDAEGAKARWGAIKEKHGYISQAVGDALCIVAAQPGEGPQSTSDAATGGEEQNA